MRTWLRDLGQLLAGAALILAVIFGARFYERSRAVPPKADRPSVYLISISQDSYPDEDVTIVRYSLNGVPQAQEFPIKASTEEFIAWLGTIGNLTNDIEVRP